MQTPSILLEAQARRPSRRCKQMRARLPLILQGDATPAERVRRGPGEGTPSAKIENNYLAAVNRTTSGTPPLPPRAADNNYVAEEAAQPDVSMKPGLPAEAARTEARSSFALASFGGQPCCCAAKVGAKRGNRNAAKKISPEFLAFNTKAQELIARCHAAIAAVEEALAKRPAPRHVLVVTVIRDGVKVREREIALPPKRSPNKKGKAEWTAPLP